MKKLCSILLISALASPSFAGLHNLTHHSRANCGTNETVSWEAGHSYWLWVVSRHVSVSKKQDHQVIADWRFIWRQAAIHWTEGTGGWSVEGHHWMKQDEASFPYQVAQEFVGDCSVYDGWWG